MEASYPARQVTRQDELLGQVIWNRVTIVPSKLRNNRFLGGLSVTVLSITKDIFVYLVITIRCKQRVKNCKFQFDSSDS
jgi:hypothetical protein